MFLTLVNVKKMFAPYVGGQIHKYMPNQIIELTLPTPTANLYQHAQMQTDAFISTARTNITKEIENIASSSQNTAKNTVQSITEQAKGTMTKLIDDTRQSLTKATDTYLTDTTKALNENTDQVAGGIMNSLRSKLGRIGRLIIK